MLENGMHATIAEIAAAEKINASYVGRVLRLTLLAPDIIEAILDGRQPTEMTLAVLMRPFAVDWERQRCKFGVTTNAVDVRFSNRPFGVKHFQARRADRTR